MTKLRELRNALLHDLANALKHKSFKRRGQSFERQSRDHRDLFHISFVDHEEDFDLTGDVAVRHHALENLVNQFRPQFTAKEKEDTASVGAEFGTLIGDSERRWTVAEPSDIAAASAQVLTDFEVIGLPYFERFDSLEEVLAVTSREDLEGCRHSPIDHERALRAVGAAYLLRQFHEARRLIESKCRYFLERGDDFGLSQFRPLAEHVCHELGAADLTRLIETASAELGGPRQAHRSDTLPREISLSEIGEVL
jgi:hypothetical protein